MLACLGILLDTIGRHLIEHLEVVNVGLDHVFYFFEARLWKVFDLGNEVAPPLAEGNGVPHFRPLNEQLGHLQFNVLADLKGSCSKLKERLIFLNGGKQSDPEAKAVPLDQKQLALGLVGGLQLLEDALHLLNVDYCLKDQPPLVQDLFVILHKFQEAQNDFVRLHHINNETSAWAVQKRLSRFEVETAVEEVRVELKYLPFLFTTIWG